MPENCEHHAPHDHAHEPEDRASLLSGDMDFHYHEHAAPDCYQRHPTSCPPSIGFDCQLTSDDLCSCVDITSLSNVNVANATSKPHPLAWEINSKIMEFRRKRPKVARNPKPPLPTDFQVSVLIAATRAAAKNGRLLEIADNGKDDLELIETLTLRLLELGKGGAKAE